MKQSHQELPIRLSQEFDRFLFETSNPSQYPPKEDEPEYALGMQLFNTDYSHQSGLRAYLRRNIELELGVHSPKPSHRLVQHARSHRWTALIKHYLPALISLILILSAWSWKAAIPAESANNSMLHPSPKVIIATVLATNQQLIGFDPRPVPTPLSSPSIYSTSSSSIDATLQQTPLGLTYTSTNTGLP